MKFIRSNVYWSGTLRRWAEALQTLYDFLLPSVFCNYSLNFTVVCRLFELFTGCFAYENLMKYMKGDSFLMGLSIGSQGYIAKVATKIKKH